MRATAVPESLRLGQLSTDTEVRFAVLPPLVRRCPDCGHWNLSTRFATVREDGPRLVVCPACHHRFRPVENPLLN